MLLLSLLACGSDPEPTACADGFDLRDDGLCYELAVEDTDKDSDTEAPDDEPPTLDDVLAALPACDGGYDDGRLDLQDGCADGACVGMTYEDFVEVLGEPVDCTAFYVDYDGYAYGSYSCLWANGVSSDWDDEDQDGVPDDGSRAYSVSVETPFDGGTAEGLSLDTTARCWVDALGEPDGLSFTQGEDGGWNLDYLYFPDAGVSVSDNYDKFGDYQPDGWMDTLYLYGSY